MTQVSMFIQVVSIPACRQPALTIGDQGSRSSHLGRSGSPSPLGRHDPDGERAQRLPLGCVLRMGVPLDRRDGGVPFNAREKWEIPRRGYFSVRVPAPGLVLGGDPEIPRPGYFSVRVPAPGQVLGAHAYRPGLLRET